ncbi:MAG: hypothetical protein JXA79_09815 [Deltaproteobacteria bacterium]|nr:hypothetical protein [Deltaproteobacteria bacterium]
MERQAEEAQRRGMRRKIKGSKFDYHQALAALQTRTREVGLLVSPRITRMKKGNFQPFRAPAPSPMTTSFACVRHPHGQEPFLV